MRTNIIIDDQLMQAAMQAGHYKTKKDAVEAGLKLVARRAAYERIRTLRGKVQWSEGDEPIGYHFTTMPNATHAVHETARTKRDYMLGIL